jgi:rod shape-determining protein MreC
MFRFLRVFQNLGTTILFVFLECICLLLIINYNKTPNEIFFHSSNKWVAGLVRQKAILDQTLDLKNQNDELLTQNASLIQELVNTGGWTIKDTSIQNKFDIIPANVINNSFHTRTNYMTVDRGIQDSIEKSMGIIGLNGLVGVINQVSEHYATAISLLHVDLRIAAAIKGKNYSGFLVWSGNDLFTFKLNGIPKHANIMIGDEIVTSGHSSIFPKGIAIGKIEEYTVVEGGAFYDITVRVDQDLSNVSNVYIVKNNHYKETVELERANE